MPGGFREVGSGDFQFRTGGRETVPNFDDDGCWQQHLQIFNAIVKSNVWTDETAALQLFAHLNGEALNVALLMSVQTGRDSHKASRIIIIPGKAGGVPTAI